MYLINKDETEHTGQVTQSSKWEQAVQQFYCNGQISHFLNISPHNGPSVSRWPINSSVCFGSDKAVE